MRFTTLAWFYNADNTLLHIRYLRFDQNTPNRLDNEFFGGTPIESFQCKLKSETQTRYHISECLDFHGQKIRHEIPYQHEQLLCSAQIDMDINFHLTELWRFLMNGTTPGAHLSIRTQFGPSYNANRAQEVIKCSVKFLL